MSSTFTILAAVGRSAMENAPEQAGVAARPHGLDLVEALAGLGSWGVIGDSSGRLVWARLAW